MAKRGNLGVELKMSKGAKLATIPVAPEVISRLFSEDNKNHQEYLEEFLGSKEIFEGRMRDLDERMEASLPNDVSDNCKFCNGDSEDENDRNCLKYRTQIQLSFFLGGTEFVNIVLRNKHIFKDFEARKMLTEKFFDCIHFTDGKGVMYLDLDELAKFTIQAGFISLSKMFSTAPQLKSLAYINKSLDAIDQTRIDNELFDKEDLNYLELQKKFFESKQRFIKEKLKLSEKEKGKRKTKKDKLSPTILHYALYYYYLQQVKEYPLFDHHPKGKVVAIQSLLEAEGLTISWKNFQLEYNKIHLYPSNRISKKNAAKIDFVANTMLVDYPKAQKIALAEYKEAQTKNM